MIFFTHQQMMFFLCNLLNYLYTDVIECEITKLQRMCCNREIRDKDGVAEILQPNEDKGLFVDISEFNNALEKFSSKIRHSCLIDTPAVFTCLQKALNLCEKFGKDIRSSLSNSHVNIANSCSQQFGCCVKDIFALLTSRSTISIKIVKVSRLLKEDEILRASRIGGALSNEDKQYWSLI
ncbi:hypothetical protein GJ496_007183 [Pomphorhynchus laevis]|nr:hypothetical protein GJ496_007183 [Pomphorhynchus laevis]